MVEAEVYVIFCPVASLLYNPLCLQTHDAIGVSRLRQLPEINVIPSYRLLTRKPIGFVHVCPIGVDGISRSTALESETTSSQSHLMRSLCIKVGEPLSVGSVAGEGTFESS